MADKIKHLDIMVAVEDGDQVKEMTVRTDNRDLLAYERTRPKQGWPTPDDGGSSTWLTFLAWSALYRAGDTDIKMREFMEDRCLAARVDKPDDPGEEVDPTRPVPGTDS